MIRISKKDDAAHDCACCTNSCPNSVRSSNRNAFHRLRYRKKAQDNKNHRNNAWNDPSEALAKFQSNCKADLKKSREQKKNPGNRH